MKRRDFMGRSSCGMGFLLGGAESQAAQTPAQPGTQSSAPPARKKYAIVIEIFEARPDSWCHKKGDRFQYPADWGNLCPWLRGSLNDFVRILEYGGTLPWKYEKTPYEKVIDPNGITTEYVRCPDPTSNLVAKITRTLLPASPVSR